MSQEYDSSDLDAILELERSPGFAMVTERIGAELERERLECERPSDSSWHAPYAQGQVKALRTVLAIPEILKGEIKAALKEQTR